MTPDGHEEAIRWIQEAEEDIAAVELLLKGKHFHLACFHAQQSAEKAVKAFLYWHNVEEPWGHSVAELIKDASTYNPSLENLFPIGATLDRYYIPTRYPNGLPGGLPSKSYFAHDAQGALDMAKQILAAIRQQIKSP